jgi:hypothetical protein
MADNGLDRHLELADLLVHMNNCEKSINELLKRVDVLADASVWVELPSPITRVHKRDLYELEGLKPRMERCEKVLYQLRQCVSMIEKSPARQGLTDSIAKFELRLGKIESELPSAPEFIPIGQAAAMLKVHRSTIKRWRLTYGTLSADDVQILPKGRWLVRRAAVQRLAAGRDDT